MDSSRRDWNDGGGSSGIPADLYLAEIPAEWGEEEIIRMHDASGADTFSITDLKLLPQKAMTDSCRSVIIKYATMDAAAAAMARIQGRSVTIGGVSSSILVRFASRSAPSGGDGYPGDSYPGAGKGAQWSGNNGGGRLEGMPARPGLRVRNKTTWSSGVITHVDASSGYMWVMIDGAGEKERDIRDFESEDGRPLISVNVAMPRMNMRVLNPKTWRAGRISWLDRENPGYVWVLFDDGEECERHVSFLEDEEGRPFARPGGHQVSSGSSAKGTWSDSPERWQGKGGGPAWRQGNSWGASDSWYGGWGRGGGAKGSRVLHGDSWGQDSWVQRPQMKPIKDPDPKLVQDAIKEAKSQLLMPDFDGRIWVRNWPTRFQPQLGQLRDFLETQSEFQVVRKGDRAYSVALKKKTEGNGDESALVGEFHEAAISEADLIGEAGGAGEAEEPKAVLHQ